MSDKSEVYFPDEKRLKETIKQLEKTGLKNEEAQEQYEQFIAVRREAVVKGMARAIEREGYNLLVEDVAVFLDIDEKQVRFNVIPYVDYIVAPQGAVEYFTLDHRKDMHFLDMQIQKWKRIFINEASFYQYLQEYLYICCPYTKIKWSEVHHKYVPIEEDYIEIPYDASLNMQLIRSCNVSRIIKERKRQELFNRTEKEILKARALKLISQERLEKEMGYLRKAIKETQFVVSTQEIKQFLKKNQYGYYQLKLYKNDALGKRVKSSVFYYFMNLPLNEQPH